MRPSGCVRAGFLGAVVALVVAQMVACDGAQDAVGDGGIATFSDGGASDGGADAGMGYAGTLPGSKRRYRVLSGRGGTAVTPEALTAAATAADAVCLGEIHDNDDYHSVQLLLVQGLSAAAVADKHPLALGMEMFGKAFQAPLDDYVAGTIDEATMLAQTQYKKRWGFDFAYYRPSVQVVVQAKQALRGLNAPSEITTKVGRTGLGSLTADERASLPELDLTNDAHRAWFRTALGTSAPTTPEAFERFYTAQVIWDETMADTAWRWLAAADGTGRRQIAVLAGVGHCIDFAIPARMRRRGATKVVSIKPVYEQAQDVADAIKENLSDFLVVMEPG